MDCIKPVLANLEFKLSKNLEKFKPARGEFKRKDKVIFYETLVYGRAYLLPCYCIRRSLEFDMQLGHIPKKLNFGLSSIPPKFTQGIKPRASN